MKIVSNFLIKSELKFDKNFLFVKNKRFSDDFFSKFDFNLKTVIIILCYEFKKICRHTEK